MKPLSADQLTRKALAYGAIVEVDGRVVNASRAKVTTLPVRKPGPPVQAEPAPALLPAPAPEVAMTLAAFTEGVRAMEARNAEVLMTVQRILERPAPAPVVTVSPAPTSTPKKWEFHIEYAGNRLSKITATAA